MTILSFRGLIARLKRVIDPTPPPPEPWLVPVRLRSKQKIGIFTRRPGATVWVPFGKGVLMERDGRGELLLASTNLETGEMFDPMEPPKRRAPPTW